MWRTLSMCWHSILQHCITSNHCIDHCIFLFYFIMSAVNLIRRIPLQPLLNSSAVTFLHIFTDISWTLCSAGGSHTNTGLFLSTGEGLKKKKYICVYISARKSLKMLVGSATFDPFKPRQYPRCKRRGRAWIRKRQRCLILSPCRLGRQLTST